MGKKCRKWIIWCALLILGITMPLSVTTAQAAQTEQGSWLNDTWSSLLGYNYSTTSSPAPTAGTNTTQETPYDSIVSANISGYTATSLSLEWISLGNGNGYHIYRKSSYDKEYTLLGTVANKQGSLLTYKDTSFQRGISYSYKIAAYRIDAATGSQSDTTSVTLTKKVALPRVSFTSVKRTGTNAKLKWKKVNGISGYEIYRKNSGSSFKKAKTVSNPSALTWTSKKVSKKKATKYKVRAFVIYNGKKVYGNFSDVLQTYSASQSSFAKRIRSLQKKFPNGKYWNHAGKSSYNSSTITSRPCDHSIGNGLTTCNHYNCPNGILGYQCYGFAWKMSDLLYGRSAKIKNFTAYAKCKPGDVVRYSGHSVIITEKHGGYVVVGECNYGNTCLIKWGRKVSSAELAGAVYSRRYR